MADRSLGLIFQLLQGKKYLDKCVKICYTISMKQIISAKLKLNTTPEQFNALRKTQLAYRDALNHVSKHAFEHGKTSNTRKLQSDCYVKSVPCMVFLPRWHVMCQGKLELPIEA